MIFMDGQFLTLLALGIVTGLILLLFVRMWSSLKTLQKIDLRTSEQNLAQISLNRELTQDVKKSEETVKTLKSEMMGSLSQSQFKQQQSFHGFELSLTERMNKLTEASHTQFNELNKQQEAQYAKNLKSIQETILNGLTQSRSQLDDALKQNTEHLNQTIEKLIKSTDQRLKDISVEVDKRLSDGFEKTTATFTDILKRLTIIDEAQKKITELSSNVVSLQDILTDKRSRGAFGEVQLNALIHNIIPESNYSLQHTLSNGKRADCFLFLPKPTGNIAIDAKFPLENFHRLLEARHNEVESKAAKQTFVQGIKKHIDDIAQKYIISGETSDGAVMFLPAEAVFAEIHSAFPEIIEYAHKMRVWITSPTTLVAILTTARAVIKDEATRKQVHIIQEHLGRLSIDFQRFEKRMENLARHIDQAQADVGQVHTSAKKIASRFSKIESVELSAESSKEALAIAEP